MMLTVVVLALLAVAGVSSQTVPCNTGADQCTSGIHSSVSMISGQIYCCPSGYGNRWTTHDVNGTVQSVCQCYKQYTERACDVGADLCHSGSSIMSHNGTIQCCQSGESMQSISHAYINGVYIEGSCTCHTYLSAGGTRINSVGGNVVIGPMTDAEKAAFAQWQQQFNAQMQQFSQNLNNQMNELQQSLANLFGKRR